jgi:hypothetical protein
VTGQFPRTRSTAGAGKLRRVTVPTVVADAHNQAAAYVTESGCSVLYSLDPARAAPAGIWLPPDELLLHHLSVAHETRLPTWDEVADVRYELVPDEVTMALLLPPRGEYVNAHDHCLHLWQIDDRRIDR